MSNRRKRKFRVRRNNQNVRYTFHSYGSHISFNPYRYIEDDRTVDESRWFERVNMLEFYKREVRAASVDDARHVYILDNEGKVVTV